MIAATRRWFRRNRTPIAIGVGVVGAGYVATQYVLNKINNARERMSSDRIAKENLRRRFEQNQEDCTFTVLALLPTATANILDAMNTEKITLEIQQMKAPRSTTTTTTTTNTTTSNGGGAPAPAAQATTTTTTGPPPSIADTTITEEEGGKSIASIQSESGVHASQVAVPPPAASAATDPGEGTSQQESAQAAQQQARRTKRQLWDDLTISSLTRCFTLIYTLALLAMLTRIQLNLLGRRSYLSSVVSLATGSPQSTINLENHDDGGNDYGNDADKADDEAASYYGSDFETNRKYLTFSWWLLNRGWTDVMERVERAVRDVFGHLSPRDLLSLDTFSQLVLEVRKKVEGGDPALLSDPAAAAKSRSSSTTSWLSFLLPPSTLEDFVLRESGVLGDSAAAMTGSQAGDATASVAGSTATTTPRSPTPASLRRLLDETSDLIESPAFTHVLTQLLDAGFSFLIHRKLLPGAFEASSSSTGSTPAPTTTAASVTSISEVAAATAASLSDPPAYGAAGADAKAVVMLPKILSVLTRQAHAVGAGMPNEYLREMELVPDLEAFAAVVYSSNWENEIRQDGAETSSSSFASLSLGGGAGGGDQQSLRGSTLVDESLVIVDSPLHSREQQQVHTPTTNSFDAAWEKATGGR